MTWNAVKITNFHNRNKAVEKNALPPHDETYFTFESKFLVFFLLNRKKRNRFENRNVLSLKSILMTASHDNHDAYPYTYTYKTNRIYIRKIPRVKLTFTKPKPSRTEHSTYKYIQINSYDIHWIDEKSDLVAINIAGNTYIDNIEFNQCIETICRVDSQWNVKRHLGTNTHTHTALQQHHGIIEEPK